MAGPGAEIEGEERPPFLDQLKSFGSVYWIANWMELVERFAYYGVRVVLPVFMVLALSEGGPEISHSQKGAVYGTWALVQSYLPIFSGGFADRYGYKLNIAISTVLKIIGYILMGYCVSLGESFAGMPLAEARPLGLDWSYEIFYVGAMFLATGTAIFKPGVQGLIANVMPEKSASLGWGMFYQMVNVGGFIGPLIAGYLRVLEWEYVFLACASGICLNFIPLFFFKEPAHHGGEDRATPLQLLWRAVEGLLEPRLFFFTISFAGFWLMFYQLFDILPNFIDDWIDSRAPAAFLAGMLGEGTVPTVNGGNLTQEWIINFNALLISLFAFAMGYLTGKVRSLSAIIAGIAVSAAAIYMLGMSMTGWWTILAIGVFSLGEMSASPTKMRYLAAIAPPGREGLYMGYVNFTVGIGWSVGSIVAGEWYQVNGDKVALARRYLVDESGLAPDAVAAVGRGETLAFFEQTLGVDSFEARRILWEAYEPYGMWEIFTVIGLVSMAAIVAYNYVTQRADRDPAFSFNTKGRLWVRAALVPIVGVFAWACAVQFSGALFFNTLMFALLLLASFRRSTAEESV